MLSTVTSLCLRSGLALFSELSDFQTKRDGETDMSLFHSFPLEFFIQHFYSSFVFFSDISGSSTAVRSRLQSLLQKDRNSVGHLQLLHQSVCVHLHSPESWNSLYSLLVLKPSMNISECKSGFLGLK